MYCRATVLLFCRIGRQKILASQHCKMAASLYFWGHFRHFEL